MKHVPWITTTLVALAASSGLLAEDKTGAKAGEMCGGIAGVGCAENLYCDYGDGTLDTPSACGQADQPGACATKPQVCTRDYNPVCGCDGKTYSNACSAHAAGMTVAKPGECPTATEDKAEDQEDETAEQ